MRSSSEHKPNFSCETGLKSILFHRWSLASPTQGTWVWVNFGSLWWTGRPGVLQSIGSQSRTRLSDCTELKCNCCINLKLLLNSLGTELRNWLCLELPAKDKVKACCWMPELNLWLLLQVVIVIKWINWITEFVFNSSERHEAGFLSLPCHDPSLDAVATVNDALVICLLTYGHGGGMRGEITGKLGWTDTTDHCCCSVSKLCPTLCDPMDCSPPGSSIHGILQEESWSGLPFAIPRDHLNPEIKPRSPSLQADSFEPSGRWHRCKFPFITCTTLFRITTDRATIPGCLLWQLAHAFSVPTSHCISDFLSMIRSCFTGYMKHSELPASPPLTQWSQAAGAGEGAAHFPGLVLLGVGSLHHTSRAPFLPPIYISICKQKHFSLVWKKLFFHLHRPSDKRNNSWLLRKRGFPGGRCKNPTDPCRRPGFDPWVRKIPWRRAWQPTPVFLPRESYGQRSLVGYSPWGHRESDMTEVT